MNIPSVDESAERFVRLMPQSTDPVLLILKGHLLVEEHIQAVLNDLLARPELLEEARLTFYQRMRLVQSLLGEGNDDYLWMSIRKLNTLRNRMAHVLELNDLEQRVDDYLADWAEDGFTQSGDEAERANRILHAVQSTCGILTGYRQAHRRIFGDPRFLTQFTMHTKASASEDEA